MGLELNRIVVGGVIVLDPVVRYGADQREYLVLTLLNIRTRQGRDAAAPTILRTQFLCEIALSDPTMAVRFARGSEVCIEGRLVQDTLPEGTPGSRRRLKVQAEPERVHVLRTGLGQEIQPLPLNCLTMTGTMMEEPTYRRLSQTREVAMFTVTNEFTRSRGGSGPTTVVSYVDCEAFGRLVPFCREHLRRGQQVVLEGRLQEDRWEQNGEPRTKLKFEIDNLQLQRADLRMADSVHRRFGSTAPPAETRGSRSPTPTGGTAFDVPAG